MCARYSDEWKAELLDPERRFHGLGIGELLEELGLEAGMTAVEYGCGPGLVALQAAVMVGPSGKVYGIDIHEGMVSVVNERADEAGLTNVSALLKDGPSAPLPDSVANLVTCFLVFHYMESRAERQELADDLARIMKPGGKVAVIQWNERWNNGVTYEETVDLLTSAGLRCAGEYSVIDNQYRVVGIRPAE